MNRYEKIFVVLCTFISPSMQHCERASGSDAVVIEMSLSNHAMGYDSYI